MTAQSLILRWLACALFFATVLAGCKAALNGAGVQVQDAWVASRATEIPVTLTVPDHYRGAAPIESVPIVVMLHGHGGSRHEAGAFTKIAQALATRGIASVRMDFPGCGESREPFKNQNLTSMLTDANSALDWAIAKANIDTQRLGVLGFSMGGRLAVTLANSDRRFQTVALWAPSVDAGDSALFDFFGGEANYLQMQALAEREGYAPFTTSWGQKQQLSSAWFSDMASSRPLERLADFSGKLFVLYGAQDTVVPPAESERAIAAARKAASAERYVIKEADHGLGLFSDEPELTREAVSATVGFLQAALGAN